MVNTSLKMTVKSNMGNYKTIRHEIDVEEVIEKSRFIGYAKPVESKEEADAFIQLIKNKHKEANHNVPVYLLGEKYDVQKYSDDGEPSGTAGLPILKMLMNEGITNIAIVITRYFGGVKLGTGGLVRAYTKTAKMALEMAEVYTVEEMLAYSIKIDYSTHGKIQNDFENRNYQIVDTLFNEEVEIITYVKPAEEELFKEHVTNLTNGKAKVKYLESVLTG